MEFIEQKFLLNRIVVGVVVMNFILVVEILLGTSFGTTITARSSPLLLELVTWSVRLVLMEGNYRLGLCLLTMLGWHIALVMIPSWGLLPH